jgi:hypothetical protein
VAASRVRFRQVALMYSAIVRDRSDRNEIDFMMPMEG